MAYIKELIDSLFEEENEGNVESFKKLIYLAVNEGPIFSPHALQLANTICPILHCIQDTTTKIYALQLLSQLATNYHQRIPPQVYDLQQAIALLSDQNTEVRKAAHYLLLIFIKKYERIDEVIQAYLAKIKESPDQWKQIQKIIHSFQSLLVIEPKSLTYPLDFTHLNSFLRFIIAFRTHQHSLIQKAAEQTLASFLKNEHTPSILSKLDSPIQQELLQMSQKLGVSLKAGQESKTGEERRIGAEGYKRQSSQNELDMMLQAMKREADWKVKSEMIQQLGRKLQGEQTWRISEDFIDGMLDYTYDYNFKICITAMNIILMLMGQYPRELSPKLRKIEDVMVEKICDLKMAVRQIAAKTLRRIFDNGSKDSPKKLLNKLASCSVVGKEQILTFLQDYYGSNLPSDLSLILTQIASQLSNENTKIKIKTLDCLVKISLSSNINQAKYILQKKLNKVYYDMFLQRLKERQPQTRSERWDDSKNNNINKGATWQAERSPNYTQPDNSKFLTKFQFAKKVDKPQEDTFEDFRYEAPTFGGMEKSEHREQKIMLGTSHTSNKTDSIYDHKKQETPLSNKLHKKTTDTYKSNANSHLDAYEEPPIQEKKLPLKPKPVKKAPMAPQPFCGETYKEEASSDLVIHSKEYQNRNSSEDVGEEVKVEKRQEVKKVRQMKLTKNYVERDKSDLSEKYSEEGMNKSAKEPFVIKKTASKKDHQLDYKATQYVSKEQLAPVQNTKDMMKEILSNLPKDNDWAKQFDSLDGLRRLIKNHEQFYPTIHQNLQAIMPDVLKLVQSLRSSLAKNAMITLAEMCEALKKSMDPFLEAIFVKLFKKAQDTNSFIIEEVNKCIRSLCSYCSGVKIAGIITNNSQSKAIPIKLKVAFTLRQLLEKEKYKMGFLKENPKLAGVMGSYITDSSQEVRSITRETFLSILGSNSLQEVEGVFRKSPKEVWEKWRGIIDKDLK